MNSKDMQKRFEASPTVETAAILIQDLSEEIAIIAKQRQAKQVSAWKAIVLQQEQTWKAFVRKANSPIVWEEAFRECMRKAFPKMYDFIWGEYKDDRRYQAGSVRSNGDVVLSSLVGDRW